jgi:hypothetical protein
MLAAFLCADDGEKQVTGWRDQMGDVVQIKIDAAFFNR